MIPGMKATFVAIRGGPEELQGSLEKPSDI